MTALPHLAFVVSQRRAAEEGRGTRRLATALLAEGAPVTLFEPEPEREPDATQPTRERAERRFELPRRVCYAARVPFWQRRARIDRMAIACERSTPELVWCCGADAWDIAIALGTAIDRPVVLDFRRHDELRGAPSAIRDDRVVALAAPCNALASAARSVVPEPLVRLVPLGVRIPDALPNVEITRDAAVVTILSEGRCDAAMQSALLALRNASEGRPDLLALVECDAQSNAQVWRAARSLGLLDRITAVERGPLTAAAVEACDLLLLPEARGGPRIESLLALGRCVPVIAAADRFADTLIDAETAVILPAGAGHDRAWSVAVNAALDHRQQAVRLAARGRSVVVMRHRSTLAAQACLSTAVDLIRGGPLRFSPTAQEGRVSSGK